MKRKYPVKIVFVKDKNKCRCCLKPFENDTEAYGVTSKIAKQFNTLTNIELKVKKSWLLCTTCKKLLKYVSKLRISIIKRSNSSNENDIEIKSSFKSLSFGKSQKLKYREHCRVCYANDKEMKIPYTHISKQFRKITSLELLKTDKICLLCINEFRYLGRVRKDFLQVHDITYQKKVKKNICCYYCLMPFRKETELKDLTEQIKSKFIDFTGIDLSYEEENIKICRCCKDKLNFVTHLKATLINNLSEDSDNNCQCCTKKFETYQKPIQATEKIESQFFQITNKKLIKYSSICKVCKFKLDYVVLVQSNLTKNHTPVGPIETNPVAKKQKKEKRILEIVPDSMILNKRRSINIKSIEEEPIAEREKTDFDCLYCDKGFTNYESLNRHMNQLHHLNAVKCRKCNEWYKIKVVDENKNITISDEKIKKFICDHCVNKSHITAGIKKAYIKKEEKIPDKITYVSIKVHKCEICGLVLKAAPSLAAHMLSVHTNMRPNQCTLCESAFKTESDLRRHIRSVHDQEKNASCTFCPKKFFGNARLKLHILLQHTDDKNFVCKDYDDCEKSFKNKYILDTHIRRVHLKERNYPCSICGTAFFTRSLVKYHIAAKHEKF